MAGYVALLAIAALGILAAWMTFRSWSEWSVRTSAVGQRHSAAEHRRTRAIAGERASEAMALMSPLSRVILGPWQYLTLRKAFYLQELGALDPPSATPSDAPPVP